jgi:magnesium-transporting ATPase (P-type)
MNNGFGGPGGVEVMFFLAIFGFFLLITFGVSLLVAWLLYRAADSIPENYRQTTPGQAFLLLIPLFGIVWIFIYTKQLSQSFHALFSATGRRQGDCGENLGMWWGIASAFSFVPCVNYVSWIPALVLMILYLVKVNECRQLALAGDDGSPFQDTSAGMTFTPADDENPYGKWD